MNRYIATVIVVPLTTTARAYPSRVSVSFQDKRGQAALDQIRTIDKSRLVKKLGQVSEAASVAVSAVLVEMFQR